MLLPWALELAKDFDRSEDAGTLKACLQSLVDIIEILRARKDRRLVPRDVCLDLWDLAMRHMRLYKRLGGNPTPKHHQFMEMVLNMERLGHSAYYATYADEGLNSVIRDVAAESHRMHWEERIVERIFLHGSVVPGSLFA